MIGPSSPEGAATLTSASATVNGSMNNNNNSIAAKNSSSPSRRNKRKPLEPKKVQVATQEHVDTGVVDHGEDEAAAIKRRRLGSTGSSEDRHSRSPVSGHSLSADDGHTSRSPSPVVTERHQTAAAMPMAPKMRFKQQQQQLQQQQHAEDLAKNTRKSPFRPWDLEDKPSVTPSPPAASLPPPAEAASLAAPSLTQQLAALPHLASAAGLPPGLGYLSPELCLRLSSLGPSLLQHLSSSPEAAARAAQAMAAAAAAAAAPPPPPTAASSPPSTSSASPPVQDEPLALVKPKGSSGGTRGRDIERKASPTRRTSSSGGSGDEGGSFSEKSNHRDDGSMSMSPTSSKGKQRNYKNMTRERRVEANARERQRVHTITAAFDTLQAAIPTGLSEEQQAQQKLSKLSIIKIATAYIMVLSRMAGYDYSVDKSSPPVDECIERCHQLIESETKFRKGGSVTINGRAP